MERFGEMVFTGRNVEEIVNFMNDWERELCGYCTVHCLVKNDRSIEVNSLSVEPADTMRGRSVYIKFGERAVRVKDGCRKYIYVENVEAQKKVDNHA